MSRDDDKEHEQFKRGGILHVHKKPSKGLQMLRLEREKKELLDRWRAAVARDPDKWK